MVCKDILANVQDWFRDILIVRILGFARGNFVPLPWLQALGWPSLQQ